MVARAPSTSSAAGASTKSSSARISRASVSGVELLGCQHAEEAEPCEPARAPPLLVLLSRRVGNHKRGRPRLDQLERRVVAALADRRHGAFELGAERRNAGHERGTGHCRRSGGERVPRRGGEEGAGDHAHRPSGPRPQDPLRAERRAQQRCADEPAAGGDHQPVAPLAARRRPVGDDEARVAYRDPEPHPRPEGVLEPREAWVAVHEDAVEVLVGERTRALVVRALVVAATHEDVAHAGEHRDGVASRGLQQGQQLAAELGAPERPQLHEHDARAHRVVRGEDQLAPGRPRLGDAEPRVVADECARRADSERRQGDQPHARGREDPVGERAAAHEHDAEAFDQLRAERVRPRQVAEADRVLAPEEQCRLHRRSARAACRKASR